MIKEVDFVELGFVFAGICRDLERGMNKRGKDYQPSRPVLDAIEQLTTWVNLPTYTPNASLNNLSIAGPWMGSGVTSSIEPNGLCFPESSTRRTAVEVKRLLLGSWNSIKSAVSSTCVPPPPVLTRANFPFLDGVRDKNKRKCPWRPSGRFKHPCLGLRHQS